MEKNDFVRIATVMRGYYPTMTITDNPDVMQVWFETFSRYDASVVMNAVKNYGDTQKYPPTVSDIKELIKRDFKQRQSDNQCPHCEGRGYVLMRVSNEMTKRLYNGQDWANDYAVPCEYCHGWKYVTREESEAKKKR